MIPTPNDIYEGEYVPGDLFQPKTSTFLHALSFECTSKLCVTFLNQFQFIFIFKKYITQCSH